MDNITTVKIKLNDGEVHSAEIENYSPQQIADELNQHDNNMVAIGGLVVQRYSVTSIIPVIEDEQQGDGLIE